MILCLSAIRLMATPLEGLPRARRGVFHPRAVKLCAGSLGVGLTRIFVSLKKPSRLRAPAISLYRRVRHVKLLLFLLAPAVGWEFEFENSCGGGGLLYGVCQKCGKQKQA